MTTDAPRLMTGTEAAKHCRVTPVTFAKWVASGIVPGPLAKTRRWDRKALDLALDKASGIVAATAPTNDNEAAENAWEAKYAARKSAARPGDGNQDARGR